MPPSNTSIAAQLRQLIYYHLDNDLLDNALFLAGRLHGLEPRSPEAAHLLALCHLRLGRYKGAYDYARDKGLRGSHLGCAYVLAQACLGLERHADGIAALERARGLWGGRNHWNKHSETSRRHLPDAAAVNCLLGKLCRAQGDMKKAVDCYVEALKLNPFMWDAYLDLCDTGAAVRPSNIFKMTPEMLAFLSHSATNGNGNGSPPQIPPNEPPPARTQYVATPMGNDPFNPSIRTGNDIGLNLGGSNLLSKLNGNVVTNGNGNGSHYPDLETPTSNGQNYDDDVLMGDVGGGPVINIPGNEPPQAPLRRQRTIQQFASDPGMEAPKMKSITTRHRLKPGSDDAGSRDATEIPRPIGQTNHKRTISGHSAMHSNQSATQSNSALSLDPTAAPQRRSVRLFNQIKEIKPSSMRSGSSAAGRDLESKERRELRKAKATGTKGRTGPTSTVGRVVSGNRKPVELTDHNMKDSRPASVNAGAFPPKIAPIPPPLDSGRERDQEVLQWLLDLLSKLGTGYYHMSRYQCQSALAAFLSVPSTQRETPWVLAQIGKAHYERSAYTEAEEVFARIKKIAPSRMDDMEVYSNVLWQLKKETDLAYLSHELIEQDRLSPQAWCAIGNSFSLQRQHDEAIKCFKRSTQLDPRFAYAFTLQGHEHVANEEFDKALFAYRSAVSADARHYNGWYGLGQVFEKMGKYEIAEKHYRAASQINPTNALLAVRIGAVLDRLRKTDLALLQYTHACDLDPRSNLARFRKAQALMKLRHPREALAELTILKDLAPDDANVHFMLGRLHKMLRDKQTAIRHFTIALNLDPKAAGLIKEAMEGLDEEGSEWSEGER
ncbi:TPR-like protein [Mytilinidion resinicola]|uniref:TPR-like protein n=1 Tax=Mytilinidion resinicola TaxID=574789 RepID=A0A6A6YEZ2_9PEZI|nr:TPR-like protein [Mytilinidion resinicola]KAF2807103.1 TPR-like protein [Mytilinidion resinicola]